MKSISHHITSLTEPKLTPFSHICHFLLKIRRTQNSGTPNSKIPSFGEIVPNTLSFLLLHIYKCKQARAHQKVPTARCKLDLRIEYRNHHANLAFTIAQICVFAQTERKTGSIDSVNDPEAACTYILFSVGSATPPFTC